MYYPMCQSTGVANLVVRIQLFIAIIPRRSIYQGTPVAHKSASAWMIRAQHHVVPLFELGQDLLSEQQELIRLLEIVLLPLGASRLSLLPLSYSFPRVPSL